jgi:hypothetical protein
MNLFISSLVQSAAQAMGDNSTHTLYVEESTTYVNEHSLMSSFYDFMNPTSIAKGIHVVAGAFLIYWILRLEYATKLFGFKTDPTSMSLCNVMLHVALSACVTGYFVFFENREALSAVTLGRLPLYFLCAKYVLNWDSKYANVHRGDYAKKHHVSYCILITINSILVYLGSPIAKYPVMGGLYLALIQSIRAMLNTELTVERLEGSKAVEKSEIIALHRICATVTIQFTVFSLALLHEVKPVRAFGVELIANILCKLYKELVFNDSSKNGFNHKLGAFTTMIYISVVRFFWA